MTERSLLEGAVDLIDAGGMASSREGLVRSFFSGTGSSYDKVAKLFTLGLDNYWKAEIVKLVSDSERVRLGRGTGILTEYLAMKYPRSEIVGVDITPDYLVAFSERLKEIPGCGRIRSLGTLRVSPWRVNSTWSPHRTSQSTSIQMCF